MKITFLGQAGLYIETRFGSVLCDPWFNPAFFGSWYPFPSNKDIDPRDIGDPDFLYVSHQHHDHFDPEWLKQHVSKDTRVLLPDYPLDRLESELKDCGFTNFTRTKNSQPMEIDGLRIMIVALVAPSDGPTGDSGLALDDGESRIFNQNDSHPMDLEALDDFGPYDGHFLQFSGAIWYPFVYNFPPRMIANLGKKKRINQQARALRYLEEIDARYVFPCAGPPCFLDDDLFEVNDFDNDASNIFCDQTVFLENMRAHGRDNGRLMIPGSVIELDGPAKSCTVTHPLPEEEVTAIFKDKRRYLEAYRDRSRPLIQRIRASWPRDEVEILPALTEWFEPLLEIADLTCAGINGRVLLDCSPRDQVVIDFANRRVHRWNGETCRYRFFIEPSLVEACILRHEEDWVNELFLSCRFRAERDGPYNEYVYNFFKCLTPERIEYAEGYYSEQGGKQEFWECAGYRIQRRCPHLKADLVRFAEISDGILTCKMHGWQFDLATGRCLTSDDRHIMAEPLAPAIN